MAGACLGTWDTTFAESQISRARKMPKIHVREMQSKIQVRNGDQEKCMILSRNNGVRVQGRQVSKKSGRSGAAAGRGNPGRRWVPLRGFNDRSSQKSWDGELEVVSWMPTLDREETAERGGCWRWDEPVGDEIN